MNHERITEGSTYILLMDHDDSVAGRLQMILAEEGYDVKLASTGEKAPDMIDNRSLDFLVADLRLPDINGMEAIGRLKEKQPDTEEEVWVYEC